MKDYNSIEKTIESILNALEIKYKKVDFEDNDINYYITFNTYGELKPLKSLNAVVYFHTNDFSMNFLSINLYMLDDKKINTFDIYELVNDINYDMPYGSFLIKDKKEIFYRSSFYCGENYISLNEKFLKVQIDTFMNGLIKLFKSIKSKENSDE